jgi:hypothetical protein
MQKARTKRAFLSAARLRPAPGGLQSAWWKRDSGTVFSSPGSELM